MKNKFTPTAEQYKYLEVFLLCKDKPTRGKLAEATGVNRVTLWNWEQDEDFNEWFYERWQSFCIKELSKVHSVLKQKALNGDMKAIKMYLERFDVEYNPKSTIKHDIKFDEEESEKAKEMEDKDLQGI